MDLKPVDLRKVVEPVVDFELFVLGCLDCSRAQTCAEEGAGSVCGDGALDS